MLGWYLRMDRVLWLSLLAGFCTSMGAILLFLKRRWGNSSLAFFLGLAAGVMAAVVFLDLLPSALVYAGYRPTIIGLGIGFLIMVLINKILLQENTLSRTLTGLGYLIMLGIALHDLPEGMAIALGDEMKTRTGMVIALAIGIHNFPEGMAIAAPLLMAGVSKCRIFFLTLMVGLITPLGTICGKAAVTWLPQWMPLLMGITSGVMLYLVIAQLFPQAQKKGRNSSRWGMVTGFLVICLATFM
jgi:ZIP family zinc transporter